MSSFLTFETLDLTKQYSYADYLKFQFKERLEILKGYIYKMSPAPSRMHQDLLLNLTSVFLKTFKNKPCKFYFAPFDVRLPLKKNDNSSKIDTVLQPDLCVICDLSKLDDRGCLGAPDLIVEILSPGNSKREMALKFDIYQEAGVKEYWIVQPEYESVFIYVLENDKFIGKAPVVYPNTLQSSLFPDLKVDLNEIFNY